VKRRERTRQLIELGGLVLKSGLADLVGDDRAVMYGAFLELAFLLHSESREQHLALWRRRGSRAFKSEKAVPAATPGQEEKTAFNVRDMK
jgi:hypothetical protein